MHDERATPAISVSGSQGIQNGSNNVQNNTYVQHPPLDPASFSGLNPHTAVDRILKLPYDSILQIFTATPSKEATEIIDALLSVDEAKTVEILGDLNPRKTTELISPLTASTKWLSSIPISSEEISQKSARAKLSAIGKLRRVTDGFFREHSNGLVIWSRFFGTHVVADEIASRYSDGDLGFPTEDCSPIPPSQFGTEGKRQNFTSGVVYSSRHGTYLVPNSDTHEAEGGISGWLGFPTSKVKSEPLGFGSFQQFEGGTVFAHYDGKRNLSFAAQKSVLDALPDPTGCWPVSRAISVTSRFGSSGIIQRFLVSAKTDSSREVAVCSCDKSGINIIAPEIFEYYHSIDGVKSGLGYPQSPWQRTGMFSGMQNFEGGNVFWRSDIGSFSVSPLIKVSAIIGDGDGQPGRLGYPTSEERRITPGEDKIQFFEHGAASLQDGNLLIFLTPGKDDLADFLPTSDFTDESE